MKKMIVSVVALTVLSGAAFAGDMSQVNGYRVDARLWNDFSASNLNINGNPYPAQTTFAMPGSGGPVLINEQFAAGELGNFANKHVAWFSEDAGASRFQGTVSQSWTVSFTVRITAPAGQPRKEGGIEIRNPRPGLGYTDEGQLMIASDGEVAIFGAVMPFHGFGNNTYTMGTTASVVFRYYAPGEADPVLGAYQVTFNDAVTGMHDSGIKFWGAAEPDGTRGFNSGSEFGFKAQNQRNVFIADSSEMEYNNVVFTPAPGAVALLGLGGLVGLRRRR